jgi:DNA-(apurinic or apyrimidinic site) lyase
MQISNPPSIQTQLADTLRKIPLEVWYQIVKKGPEWHELEPLRHKFPDAAFSVFMMVVGLNAFQLKGRAEQNYFPQLYECLKNLDSISCIDTLHEFLAAFYKKERLNATKIERLSRFLQSSLAQQLWTISPQKISYSIEAIWHALGTVMNQKLYEKTICFAMKCLGVSLIMADENNFDFGSIPIPVDSRVCKFTNSLGIDFGQKSRLLQRFWGDVLASLRSTSPRINMIHLDSLIWQIAHHDTDEMQSYFKSLGININFVPWLL